MRHNKMTWWILAVVLMRSGTVAAEQLESFTEPYRSVAVPAPEIGVISEILVKEGDEILQSQVLARLDDDVLRASLDVARAAKDSLGARRAAEIELQIREQQRDSYRALHEEGNATQRELDRAESDYEQALSRLQSAIEDLEVRRLEYERVKAQLRQRMIRSTIDGYVVSIQKEVGEFVSPTDPVVMNIVHLKTLKVVFSVPTDTVQRISVDQKVTLTIGYEKMTCSGVVEYVSPIAELDSNTVKVKIRVPNPDQKLPSGVVCHWDLKSSSGPKGAALRQARNSIEQNKR
ncbi:MAG: efflux RND transporter periplasmic adaptor subunit [Planctomycetota bacterium]